MPDYQLVLSKRSMKFLKSVQPKHAAQLKKQLLDLVKEPFLHNSKKLAGYDCFRVDSGEYRTIYRVENKKLMIALIGKRNDDEVYKKLNRLNK